MFSFRTTCIVYIGQLYESSSMTQIYRSEDIVCKRIEKKWYQVVSDFWIKFQILPWSHWVFFHPAWHPPTQCPVTLSQLPGIVQCMLQFSSQFCPYLPFGHSVCTKFKKKSLKTKMDQYFVKRITSNAKLFFILLTKGSAGSNGNKFA